MFSVPLPVFQKDLLKNVKSKIKGMQNFFRYHKKAYKSKPTMEIFDVGLG